MEQYDYEWKETQLGRKPLLVYHSLKWPGKVLEFSWKCGVGETKYYRCIVDFWNKEKTGDDRYQIHIRIKNGILVTNPDYPPNPHFCIDGEADLSTSKSLAKQFERCNRSLILFHCA